MNSAVLAYNFKHKITCFKNQSDIFYYPFKICKSTPMSPLENATGTPVSITHKSTENKLAKQIATPEQINYLIYVAGDAEITEFLSKLLQVIEGNLSYISSGNFPDEETKNRINVEKVDILQALHGALFYLRKKELNGANAKSINQVAEGIVLVIEKILAVRKLQQRDISFLTACKEDANEIVKEVSAYTESTQRNITAVQLETGEAMKIVSEAEERDLEDSLSTLLNQIEATNNDSQKSQERNTAIAKIIKTAHYQKLLELSKDRSSRLGKLAKKALFIVLENLNKDEISALL